MLWSLLDRARRLFPNRPAVSDAGSQLSWRETGHQVDRLAHYLAARSVAPGDRIATLLPNSPLYLEAYFAAAGLGAILVPLNTRLSPGELRFILQDSESVWLIADREYEPLAIEAVAGTGVRGSLWADDPVAPAPSPFRAHAVAPESPAQLYYTSGTTGVPKGVILTHRNVATHALAAIAELGLSERDSWAHVAPMFHLADAWATFAITWAGGRHVMFRRFDVEETLAGLERESITITNLVPTMLNLMVKHPARSRYDYRRLRMLLSGGAPIAPAVVAAIVETFGCEYVQTYGMTETSPYLTLSLLKDHLRTLPPEDQLRFRAKTGRPFMAVELKVVGEHGTEVAADEREVGEILVRGETVTPGYWRRPEETRAAFQEGWFRTGDLAVVDAEGYLTIVDRRKDMIITGGEKVYSTEVESVLYQHPAILEAAVFGTADEIWGEVVTAAVVPRPGERISAEEVMAFCRDRLTGFKQPRRVQLLAALPRTGSGKILKRALAERWPAGEQESGNAGTGE